MQRDLLMERRVYSGLGLMPSDQYDFLAAALFRERLLKPEFSRRGVGYWWCHEAEPRGLFSGRREIPAFTSPAAANCANPGRNPLMPTASELWAWAVQAKSGIKHLVDRLFRVKGLPEDISFFILTE